jgi:hypothetical protein
MLKGRRALKWSPVERLRFLEHDSEEAGRQRGRRTSGAEEGREEEEGEVRVGATVVLVVEGEVRVGVRVVEVNVVVVVTEVEVLAVAWDGNWVVPGMTN